jgi:hypothetical protein
VAPHGAVVTRRCALRPALAWHLLVAWVALALAETLF